MQFVRLEVERRVAALAVPMFFSGDETCDVGKGTGSAVSPDYDARDNEFSGEVNWVQIDLEKDVRPDLAPNWQIRAQGQFMFPK